MTSMETETTPLAQAPIESALPPDCQHPDWTLGCERCFQEMRLIARNNIKSSSQEDQMQGAILFNWHMVTVLEDCEIQLAPLTQSLDLNKQSMGKAMITNLRDIKAYLIKTVMNPARLQAALVQAATLVQQVNEEVKRRQQEGTVEEVAPTPSSIVLTDVR